MQQCNKNKKEKSKIQQKVTLKYKGKKSKVCVGLKAAASTIVELQIIIIMTNSWNGGYKQN